MYKNYIVLYYVKLHKHLYFNGNSCCFYGVYYSVYPNMKRITIRIKYWTKIGTFTCTCTRISMSKVPMWVLERKQSLIINMFYHSKHQIRR